MYDEKKAYKLVSGLDFHRCKLMKKMSGCDNYSELNLL